MVYETRLDHIAGQAIEKEEENDQFLRSLKQYDGRALDDIVYGINDEVSTAIDCTACGNCCKSLIINVTAPEIKDLAEYLEIAEPEAKKKYIEESQGGAYFINSIPCHFLSDNKCSIYEHRFAECRDFPHLHKPGFRERFLGTLLHYGRCPIVYNVVEELKIKVNFKR
jgi:Fe-S-cluster containining protein